MRVGLVVLALAAALGTAACGGDDEAAPLTLEQRFVTETDAAGYKPDPVEGGKHVWRNLQEFVDATAERRELPAAEVRKAMSQAGFVEAIGGTRYLPLDGKPHSRSSPHLVVNVARFESSDGAKDALDWFYEEELKPCPGKCAFTITEFEVDGIPDAKGARRYVTKERLEQTGEEGAPFAAWTILFVDGPYGYFVGTFGPPGENTSEAHTEAIANRIYDRVKGAPPPD